MYIALIFAASVSNIVHLLSFIRFVLYARDVPGQQLSDVQTELSLDPCSVGPLARLRSRKPKPSQSSVVEEDSSQVTIALA